MQGVGRVRVEGGLALGLKHSYRTEGVTKSFEKSNSGTNLSTLFFILVMIRDKLTDLCLNRLLQNDFISTFCEMTSTPAKPAPAFVALVPQS